MKTIFKRLVTGDIFSFVNEETIYLVCYNKRGVLGDNKIESLQNPRISMEVTPSMMHREVLLYSTDEIAN